MFDRSDLRAAVAANVLTADQAARFEAFAASRHGSETADGTGQENLRFLANFNDIFITLGLIILFIGVTSLVGIIAAPSLVSGDILIGVISAAFIAGLAWVLLEYFCARRRLLLPSMALTLIFSSFTALAATAFVASLMDVGVEFDIFAIFSTTGMLGVTNFAVAALAAALVFYRFRLPFALGEIAVMASVAVYLYLAFYGDIGLFIGGAASFVLGIVTLLVAIWFDMQDPERIRKSSDNAFWLHFAAAPQIIFGVNTLVTGSSIFVMTVTGADNAAQGIVLLIVLLSISLVSLALNRRALIAASLLTFIITLSFVLNRVGLNGLNIFVVVTIIIGSGVVLLGAGWKTARRAVLIIFPRAGLWGRMFPPEPH